MIYLVRQEGVLTLAHLTIIFGSMAILQLYMALLSIYLIINSQRISLILLIIIIILGVILSNLLSRAFFIQILYSFISREIKFWYSEWYRCFIFNKAASLIVANTSQKSLSECFQGVSIINHFTRIYSIGLGRA